MKSKYKGIDERQIKCCSTNPESIEAGISFDEVEGQPTLRFHFLKVISFQGPNPIIDQDTKGMFLNKQNTEALIKELKKLKFKTKK